MPLMSYEQSVKICGRFNPLRLLFLEWTIEKEGRVPHVICARMQISRQAFHRLFAKDRWPTMRMMERFRKAICMKPAKFYSRLGLIIERHYEK